MSVQQSKNAGYNNLIKFMENTFANHGIGKGGKLSGVNGTNSTKSQNAISDALQLSPKTKMMGILSEYKQSAASKLSISVNVKADKPISDSSTQSKLTDKADKMLRLISRNDEEYNQLKTSFDDMFGDLISKFKDTPSEDELSGLNIAESASIRIEEITGEMTIQDGNRIQKVQYSSYKLTMNFTNVTAEEASNDKSLASQFTNALADFFGYGKSNDNQALPTEKSSSDGSNYNIDSTTFTYEAKSLKYSSSTTIDSGSNASKSASTASAVNTYSSSYMRLQELALQGCDPIVLDLSGEGINLTQAGKGSLFDINADGKLDSTAWVKGNTGMLVYDKNGNGKIDNGKELFGDQNGASNGFKELSKYDKNGDGRIDSKDAIYKNLKLYRDLNGDGKMQKNEFSTLKELGIKSLNLECFDTDDDVNGNSIVLRGSFEREDGTKGEMADAIFGYSELKN